jgi:hypothetical protein
MAKIDVKIPQPPSPAPSIKPADKVKAVKQPAVAKRGPVKK